MGRLLSLFIFHPTLSSSSSSVAKRLVANLVARPTISLGSLGDPTRPRNEIIPHALAHSPGRLPASPSKGERQRPDQPSQSQVSPPRPPRRLPPDLPLVFIIRASCSRSAARFGSMTFGRGPTLSRKKERRTCVRFPLLISVARTNHKLIGGDWRCNSGLADLYRRR